MTVDQPTLSAQEREYAAVACSLYGDEFSGGEAFPDLDADDASDGQVFDFSAAEGELLQSACTKLAAGARGERADDLSEDEMRLAAIACDLYADEFCDLDAEDPEAWGEQEAQVLWMAANKICATLGLGDGITVARPARESIRYGALDAATARWAR
jgi:hypothetical protein